MINRIIVTLAVLCAAVTLSCSMMQSRPGGDAPMIRFVNLKHVYEYFINKSKDARDIAKQKDDVIATLRTMETQMADPKTATPELALNYQRKKQLYAVISKEEDEHKKKMSQRINQALTDIAEDTGVDFILNIGDEVIYGKKKYDITEDVIREVMNIGKRSEPIAR